MNTKTIEKCINTLNPLAAIIKSDSPAYKPLADTLQLLKLEFQKAVCGNKSSTVKLQQTVKKYLSQISGSRPVLKTIEHTADGREFVIDGYSGVLFEQRQPELDIFPQTDAANSVNLFKILDFYGADDYAVTDTDLTILNNIDKYITLYKKEEEGDFVFLFGKPFSAKLIKRTIDIIKAVSNTSTSQTVQIKQRDNVTLPTFIVTEKATGIILPMRINAINGEECYARMERFLALLADGGEVANDAE